MALLAAVLAMAVVRPRGLPEALVAVPAAGMTFVLGLVSTSAVHDEIARLLPVLVFLAAIFVLARMCAVEGVFTATGDWLARSSGDSSRRLLLHVFAVGAVVTSVLSLDATAVLLTPVVAATAIRMEVPPKPHVYATGHLANTAMDLPFVAFVMGLAVVVRAAVDQGLGPWIDDRLPDSDALPALLVLALVGAILANVVNNLPALLILLPFATAISPLAVLVVLIGVNIGPNLVYTGSLATLLWRRVATEHGVPPTLRQFTVLGLATVPAAVGLGAVALWAWSLALPFA